MDQEFQDTLEHLAIQDQVFQDIVVQVSLAIQVQEYQVSADTPVFQVIAEILVTLVFLVILVFPVIPVSQVTPDSLEIQAHREFKASPAGLASRVSLATLVLTEPLGSRATLEPLGTRALRESLGCLVTQEFPAIPGHRALRASREFKAFRGSLVSLGTRG